MTQTNAAQSPPVSITIVYDPSEVEGSGASDTVSQFTKLTIQKPSPCPYKKSNAVPWCYEASVQVEESPEEEEVVSLSIQ